MSHLIDTCIWIDFLRGKKSEKTDLLELLLDDGSAYMCGITYAEICQGAQDLKQFEKYAAYFKELPFLELPDKWHLKLAMMGHKLKKTGYKPFVADLMIALLALQHDQIMLTNDSDFKPLQKLFGLKLQ